MSAKPSHAHQRRLDAAPAKICRASTEAAQFVTWMHPTGLSHGLDALERYLA